MSDSEEFQGVSGDPQGPQDSKMDPQTQEKSTNQDSKSTNQELSEGIKSIHDNESLKNGRLSDPDVKNGHLVESDINDVNKRYSDVNNGDLKGQDSDNGSSNGDLNGEVEIEILGDAKLDNGAPLDAKSEVKVNEETRELLEGKIYTDGDKEEFVGGKEEDFGGKEEDFGGKDEAVGGKEEAVGGKEEKDEAIAEKEESVPGKEETDGGKDEGSCGKDETVGVLEKCEEVVKENHEEIEKDKKDDAKEMEVEDTVDSGGASQRKSWPRQTQDKEQEEKDEEDKDEGVDPFSMKPGLEEELSKVNKKGKSVVFKEPDEMLQNGNSHSSPSSSGKGKEEGEGDGDEGDTLDRRKQWNLGEGNPVYRLSMKLSPNLFNLMDIPAANQHQEAEKAGYLNKLSGRSFPYIPQWKRRYCVLSKGRLFYYEREDSRQGEKNNGVINLEYFDQVHEAGPKDCKKATNVFIITSQDRSFFDPGRHLFSADTLPDMKDWIRRLHGALELIRNNNRPTVTNSSSAMDTGRKRKEENGVESKEDKENKDNQMNSSSRERKKKKEDSHRSRKTPRTTSTSGVTSETQTPMTEPHTPATNHDTTTTTTTTGGPVSPKGGVALPGFTAFKPKLEEKLSMQIRAREETKEAKRVSQGESEMHTSAGPTLTSVTKHRPRGPQGRRPPNRRTMVPLKERASSLSALEHQDSTDTSNAPWLNRSLDVLEGEPPWRANPNHHQKIQTQTSLPYKTYNYSSDEDEHDFENDEHSDSFLTSASGIPPPPPPRSASYGLDMQPSCPPSGGIRCHGLAHIPGDEHLRADKHWRREIGSDWDGSQVSLGQNGEVSGGASPVMDDLDNLLMNQSLQHTGAAPQDLLSDEASEGSTCRAAHQPHSIPNHHHKHTHDNHHTHDTHHRHTKSQDLSRFAAAVRHLQKHVVDIDRAVMAVTGEVGGTRQEVEGLKEAVVALQADTHTITTTLSGLTQQAITAQHKITQATQDAERVQQAVAVALREAEWAREEQLRTKQEYENLLVEVRATLQGIRDSPGAKISQGSNRDPSPDVLKDSYKESSGASKNETGRSGTNFMVGRGSSIGPVLVDRSSSASSVEKPMSTYQSLFSKPSNFISGLTARHSLTKSVSFVDQKNKRKSEGDDTRSASLDRRIADEKSPTREDKKSKKEDKFLGSFRHGSLEKQKDKHQNSLDKKDKKKESKDQVSKDSKNKGSGSIDRKDKRGKQDKRSQNMISGLCDDDIPMADDSSHEVIKTYISPKPDPPNNKVSTSRITFNFSLGKSSSSPTVPTIANRPRALPLNQNRPTERSTSPESPALPSSFSRPGSLVLATVDESPPVSETGSPLLPTLHRPGSTPGPLARQGSMTTVPEDREVTESPPTPRTGVYAISRQHSSPNIPVQRQGSGSMFQIQRQNSLGTVRDGRLPRQDSLSSVPEERVVVDRTLPLSPSQSMTYVPLSPSASMSAVSDSARQAARESMELVTGPVLAGSAMQEAAATGTLPVLMLADEDEPPAATSSLKKNQKSQTKVVGIFV